MNEVYVCGHCPRQQEVNKGVRCISCGSMTVSWFLDRESWEAALVRWCKLYRKSDSKGCR
jgi:hypothetical protein